MKRHLLTSIIITLFSLTQVQFIKAQVATQDSLALVDLYNSTNGPGWTNKTNWLTGPVNNWYGVTVTANRVVYLQLSSNQLSNAIPSSLGNLSNLERLYLNDNQLSGTFPLSFGNLIKLKKIYLSGNLLNGVIPSFLGNLSNLKELVLERNQFRGNIPSSLGNLSNLQILGLNTNQLLGDIPSTFVNLSSLQQLDLSHNLFNIQIPEVLTNLSNLQILNLSQNQFSGEIPAWIGNLSNLQYLKLDNNNLNGNIPESIGNLSNLLSLSLYVNQFKGNIPLSIGSLSNLQFFCLQNNQLTGNIPSSLGNLLNLQDIDLSDNQITGAIPESLGNLTNLFYLFLSDNHLSGNIPSSLGNLSKLQFLYLSWNQLTGPIPESIGNLSSLPFLNLGNNQLTGSVPISFGNLTKLQNLYLANNQFSSLPLLSASLPKNAQIQSNLLTFDDIIPNLTHISNYSPQNKIGLSKTTKVTIGNTYTFNLGIDSSLTTNTYKWYKNGQLYNTTTKNELVINNVTINDAGIYTCTITNPGAPDLTLYSNPDTLVVQCAPQITTQPIDQTVCDGTTASFSVTATGTGLNYQWLQTSDGGATWNTISGATNATYSFTAALAMNDNFYRCIITGGGCTQPDTSDAAQLTVNLPPHIVTQPADQLVNEGADAGFSVAATGTDLTYQWQQSTDGGASWTTISGETSAYHYIPEATSSMNTYRYKCIVSNSYGSVTSNHSRLILNPGGISYIRPPDTTSQTIDKNLSVGATSGVFNVSPTGGATYSVPIACPPGLANIKPNISVTYNSQSGNGLVGWGWNIAGISAISRVPQTVYSDGAATGLIPSISDRFALDGNRLVSYNGVYGADNSTYRTENETFVNIISHGVNTNNSPTSFEVQDKNGTTYKYGIGNGHLNYDQPQKHATLSWFLDYAQDIHGNFITYDYEQRGLYTYLKKIKYGCNSFNNSQNYYTIEFTYKKRTDSIPVHVDQVKGSINLLLDSIVVKNADTIYRQYKFEYTFDVFSKLVRIIEINGIGQQLNPTIVKWGADNKQIIESTPVVDPLGYIDFSGQYYSSADVNGDGLTDIVSIYPHDTYTCGTPDDACAYDPNKGIYHTNFVQVYNASLSADHTVKFTPGTQYDVGPNVNLDTKSYITGNSSGDIDGDGKSEIIVAKYKKVDGSVSGQVYFYILIDGGSKPIVGQNLQKGNEMPFYAIADFNNDGKDEILYMEKDYMSVDENINHVFAANIQCLDNLGQGHWEPFQITLGAPYPKQLFVLDINGDGLKDLLLAEDSGYEVLFGAGDIKVTLSSGAYYAKPTFGYKRYYSNFGSNYAIKQGDFNGDGLPDFILSKKGTAIGEWYLAINNGQSGFDLKPLPGIVACDDKDSQLDDDKDNCIVTDFNNDGKTDVIITNANYNWKHNFWGQYWKVFDKVTTYWYKSTGEDLVLVRSAVSGKELDAYNRFSITGDFNGDGRLDLMNYGYDCYDQSDYTTNWKLYSSFNKDFEGNMVTAISDGMKRKTTIAYRSISCRDNYSVSAIPPTYPLALLSQPLYVVKQTDNTGGVLGKLSTIYSYKDATFYSLRGFLGFGQGTASNSAKQTTADSYYAFSKTLGTETFYMPYLTKTVVKHNNDSIQKTKLDYTLNSFGGKWVWMYQNLALSTNFLKNTRDSVGTVYNTDGNLISTEVKNIDAGTSTVISTKKVTYNNYADRITIDGNTIPNGPGNIRTEQTHADAPGKKFTDTTTLIYNTDGTIQQKTNFAGRAKYVNNAYTYYSNGNIHTESVSSPGLITRTSTSTYDVTGRLLASQQNAVNHKTEYGYDNFGRCTSQKDPNGAITLLKYDKWGTLIEKTAPDNITTAYHLSWADGGDIPADALYYSDVVYDGIFKGADYKDLAGNLLRKVTTGYEGARYYQDTKYASAGEVVEVYEPCLTGNSTTKKTTYNYDYLNRLATITQPNAVTLNYTYPGNTVRTEYSTGEVYIKTYDAAGLLKQSIDPGGTINYLYNSIGKPFRIVSPGSTIEMNYNIFGQQDTLKDPNAGKTAYAYNAYGELISQVNAKGTTALTYDTLSRVKTKTIGNITTTYTYDKGTRAKGTLTRISSTNGAAEAYAYSTDGLCRITNKTRRKENDSLTYQYAYDAKGRVNTLTYPAGFAVTYSYNNYNDLTAIYNANNATTPIWRLDNVNNKGQLQNATYGNGKQITYGYDTDDRLNRIYVPGIIAFNYQFNNKQQLVFRDEKYYNLSGVWQGIQEYFTYDGVNRLATASGATSLIMTYTSGVNDRIASKSDAGSYVYNNLSNHHLDTLRGVTGYLPLNHTISYTTENKVDTIKENGKVLAFGYGTDNQRFKTEYKENNTLKYTRFYFGGYEKEVQAGAGTVRHLNYIYAAGKLIAINVKKNTGRDTMFYLYTDYLGSLRCITDSIANVKQRLSFDAWGNRRDPITGVKLTSAKGLLFARGFTGHEHLDEFSLINMNGRVYDPMLGMFISPDNFVQAPDNTQNFNRYAYCYNNPLMYTDPTGEYAFWDDAVAMAAGGIYNLASNAIQGNIHSFGEGIGYFVTGVAAGEATLYGGPVAGGAVLGLGNNLTSQISQNGLSNISWGQAALSTGMGAATSYLGGQIGNAISPYTSSLLSGITNRVLYNALDQGINNAISGFVVGTGTSLLMGNDLNTALGEGGKGAAFGGTLGLMSGTIQSIQIQRQINNEDLTPLKSIEGRVSGGQEAIRAEIGRAVPNGGAVIYRTSYSNKVTGSDGQHVWNRQTIQIVVDNGEVFPGMGYDGKSILVQQVGTHNGVNGIFEIIVKDGMVTHQRFIPGGFINGIPNQIAPGISGSCGPAFPWWNSIR